MKAGRKSVRVAPRKVHRMSAEFDKVVSIMARLRAPDGCPWDRKQTRDSLKPYLLEETYEVL